MRYSHYEIAIKANQLRKSFGVDSAASIENIFRLLESNGYQVFRYPLGEDAILGIAARYGNDRVIITNSSLILSREIYTAAHELGHHVLHLTERNDAIVDDADSEQDDEDEIERDANYFAACFLMPSKTLEEYVKEYLFKTRQTQLQGIDISKIQSEFNVSFEALVNRLSAIKVITPEEKTALEEEKAEKTARSFFKAVGGNEALLSPSEVKYIPTEFLKMILSNYQNKLVPIESVKKVFDAFEIPLPDIVDADSESSECNERRRSRRGINNESDVGY